MRNKKGQFIKGHKSGMTGKAHLQETKDKMSKSQTGRKLSEEHKQKLRNRVYSLETRKKMSLAKCGYVPWNKGKIGVQIVSEETRKKLSLASKGRKLSLEHVAKIKKAKENISPETRKKLSDSLKGKARPWCRGENHFRWVFNRTQLVKSEKKHLDGRYRGWTFSVKNRDRHKCKIANSDCKGRLEAHHILNWMDYPELRYEINNGITLCHGHHPRGRTKEKQLSSYFMELVLASNE